MVQTINLLKILQLSSPNLPLGAYSYSEGLETLVEQKKINSSEDLFNWLSQQLKFSSIRIETAIMIRSYENFAKGDFERINYWNNYLTANRETKELRQQSWQMGNSLIKLLLNIEQNDFLNQNINKINLPCNYSLAFGITAQLWNLSIEDSILSYLQSWTHNLITVGVKLIPLGQTQGQKILNQINEIILVVYPEILSLKDDQLFSCNIGLSLASMKHEQLYSRLFRS
jgi:urease accessory protein